MKIIVFDFILRNDLIFSVYLHNTSSLGDDDEISWQ